MEKARFLIADALRLRVADSLNTNLNSRIVLLENQYKSSFESFTNLLKIEQEKFQVQKEITSHMEDLSKSYREQLTYYQKRERKQRIQNRFLKVGVTLAAGFIVYQSVK